MILENRIVVTLGEKGGGMVIRRGHESSFWFAGKFLWSWMIATRV